MVLDEKACSPLPMSIGDLSGATPEVKEYVVGLMGSSDNLNLYGIKSSDDFKKFFILRYDDNVRRISCPITMSGTSKITKGSIGVFVLYNVDYEKRKSYEIKA
jgi:hypothetical protein